MTGSVLFLMAILAMTALVRSTDEDRFWYRDTDFANRIFGPEDWNQVECENISTCPGWPTNWKAFSPFITYNETDNTCKHCAESTAGICADHTQSPLHLYRNVTATSECLDRHRMNFVEGTCRFQKFDFQILPHGLRAYTPEHCDVLPSIDFSLGFPFPWLLVFTEISVPSQHTQDGKRYHAEVVLSHVYSVDNGKKRVRDAFGRCWTQTHRLTPPKIGNVSIFLQKGSIDETYDFLELYIRSWQATALKVQEACNLRRRLQTLAINTTGDDDDDVESFQPGLEDGEYDDRGLGQQMHRDYFDREFQPYDWYVKSGTEYYFRYKGSTLVPPCHEAVHWRVLREPIRVAPSQISALEGLIANRIDPSTCEAFTAGKPRSRRNWRVSVDRPTQTTTDAHHLVYCECVDWRSRKEKDVEYCALSMEERGVFNLSDVFNLTGDLQVPDDDLF